MQDLNAVVTAERRAAEGSAEGADLGLNDMKSLGGQEFGDFASLSGHHIHLVASLALSLGYGEDHLLGSGELRRTDQVQNCHAENYDIRKHGASR